MEILVFALRIAVLLALYAFIALVISVLWHELKLTTNCYLQEAKPATAKLVVLDGGDSGLAQGDVLPVEGNSSIGSLLGNSIVLMDMSVSGRHAFLTFENGCWWLEDNHSTNGTTINGMPVKQRLPLHDSDVIGLGRVRLQLKET